MPNIRDIQLPDIVGTTEESTIQIINNNEDSDNASITSNNCCTTVVNTTPETVSVASNASTVPTVSTNSRFIHNNVVDELLMMFNNELDDNETDIFDVTHCIDNSDINDDTSDSSDDDSSENINRNYITSNRFVFVQHNDEEAELLGTSLAEQSDLVWDQEEQCFNCEVNMALVISDDDKSSDSECSDVEDTNMNNDYYSQFYNGTHHVFNQCKCCKKILNYNDKPLQEDENTRRDSLIKKYNLKVDNEKESWCKPYIYSMKLYRIFGDTNVYCEIVFINPSLIKEMYSESQEIPDKQKPIQIKYHIQLSDSPINNQQAIKYIEQKVINENINCITTNTNDMVHYSSEKDTLICSCNKKN